MCVAIHEGAAPAAALGDGGDDPRDVSLVGEEVLGDDLRDHARLALSALALCVALPSVIDRLLDHRSRYPDVRDPADTVTCECPLDGEPKSLAEAAPLA